MNDFPPRNGRTTFSVVTPPGGSRATWWESNVADIPARIQGKEYRISRTRLPGLTVRLAAEFGVFNDTLREGVSFPKDHGFSSADRWAELVLPPAK